MRVPARIYGTEKLVSEMADKVKSPFKEGVREVIMPKGEEAKKEEVEVKIE